MPLIEWSDNLSVDIDVLDNQHKKLIDIVNNLYDAKRNDRGHKVVKGLLDDLLTHADTHFAKEEELMKQHGYPELDMHKAQHEELVERASHVYDLHSRHNVDIVDDLTTLLENWMTDHFIKRDKGYHKYFKNKGVV